MKQTIQDWALIIIMLLALPFIWIYKKLHKETYMTCEHGATGNSIWMMFKTCKGCAVMLVENRATDEFIREYTKECITRYEKLLRRLANE